MTLAAFSVLRVVAYMAGAVAIVYFGITVPIRETAGQETVLTVGYRAVLDMKMHIILPYVAAGGFGWLWWSERRTRITAVERENADDVRCGHVRGQAPCSRASTFRGDRRDRGSRHSRTLPVDSQQLR